MISFPFTQLQIALGTAAFFVLFLLFIALLGKRKHAKPYERISSILTPAEQRFYRALTAALQGRALVMAKVRIADLLKVRSTVPRKLFWRYFSKISQKHIDFVLVDPKTFTTLCVIELDDKSHEQNERKQRDAFVDYVMKQVEIPLHRFPVRRSYNLTEFLKVLDMDFRRMS